MKINVNDEPTRLFSLHRDAATLCTRPSTRDGGGKNPPIIAPPMVIKFR